MTVAQICPSFNPHDALVVTKVASISEYNEPTIRFGNVPVHPSDDVVVTV